MSSNPTRRSPRISTRVLPPITTVAFAPGLDTVPEQSSSDSEENIFDRTVVDFDNTEPAVADMEDLARQLSELRAQLEAVTSDAANEKAERIRLQNLLCQDRSMPAATTETAITDPIVSISAASPQTVSASATTVLSATAVHDNTPPSSVVSLPLSLYQPSQSIYTATSSSTIATVPTFLPPLSASAPCNQSAVPPRLFSLPPVHTSHSPSVQSRKLQDLPVFTGSPEEWPMFCTAFVESTALFGYTKTENLFRLQKAVRNEAREVVESLLIHPDNIEHAMAALEFRFGRPECLLQSQLGRVRAIAPIHESKIEMIVPFATTVQNLTTFLEASGLCQHLANPTLVTELVNKLPMSKRLEWAKQSVSYLPSPSVKHFSEWLTEVARYVCLVTPNLSLSPAQTEHKKKILHVSEADPSSSSAATVKGKCRYCHEKMHPVAECETYVKLSVPAKWIFVKKNRLCFHCLKYGHNLKSCRVKKVCGIDGCPKTHHSSLHESSVPLTKPVLSCQNPANVKILYRVVPVKLYGNGISISTYALFDEGSSVTILSAELSKKLHLVGRRNKLNLQWFGKETVSKESFVVDADISADRNGAERYKLCGLHTVDDLALPTQSIVASDLQLSSQYVDLIPLVQYTNAKPEILIGLDNSHLGAPIRTFELSESGPIAAETKLGWVVYGRSLTTASTKDSNVVLHSHPHVDDTLHNIVEEYLAMDNFGVKKPKEQPISQDDKRSLAILSTTTVKLDGRYQTGLLWKKDATNVPDSYGMARQRLLNLENRFQRDANYAEEYRRIIASFVEKGYAKKLTATEASVSTPKTWHLPHFGVKNPNKPGKVRLVFDAAAKTNDVSLNSLLLKGPDEMKPMMSILFNFRLRAVAVTGDIKEMFLQIGIQAQDQHSQRFLWRKDRESPIDVYVMKSMIFGASCSPCSANYVKNFNASKYSSTHPRAVSAIIDRHYVDDYVDSFDTEAEAVEITNAVISIHKEGGFELRNFSSNSIEVLRKLSVRETEHHQNRVLMMNSDTATEKILGMCWDPVQDTFKFRCAFPRVNRDVMDNSRCPTKREFLSIAMSMFDPFGMVATFTIHMKLLLRSVSSYDVKWDESIPHKVYELWIQWKSELPSLLQFRMPRCHDLHLTSAKEIVLHTFVDASEDAFSAVSFLRFDFDGCIRVSFVCGKTKCAPKKLMSIPRLELSAAILGVRLSNAIVEGHDLSFSKRIFWSDSRNVITWISSEQPRRYKQFVAFRIAEILESSKANQWHRIPSKLNPADEATRARYPPTVKNDCKWINGPDFLQLPEKEWSLLMPRDDDSSKEDTDELRPRYLLHATTVSNSIIDLSRFSKYPKLLRCVAWMLRFTNSCQKRQIEHGELSARELEAAEKVLCVQAQSEVFALEIATLSGNQPIEKASSLFKLTPYLDSDGLLKVSGRIDAATSVPFTVRRPIILPKSHRLTKLIVEHYHCRLRHQNDDAIANQIRLRFWVPSIRSAVRKAKSDCLHCRLRFVKPQPPLMGQLPEDRLTPFVRPFTYTGLDYFGPIDVTIGRRKEKRWVALFTCMTVRAVHLEIAEDLSTDACMICIRNFVNRRGVPKRIRSDNGTNFVGAKKELLSPAIFDNDAIKAELSLKGIEWLFNCPLNPHAGGCWERLVQSVKRALSHTLKEVAPRLATLQSALIEAENIVNGRPLTHLPVSPEDEEPLTPNHFLLGVPNSTQIPGDIDNRALCLRKQWRISQQLKDRFWKKWIEEYLPVLTKRSKWFQRVKPLEVGDLCLVCDTNVPRSRWLRGRIVKVFPGRDGQTRVVEVMTSTGIFRRPATKIAVLDIGEALIVDRLTGGGMS